jgi:hypothetical protein
MKWLRRLLQPSVEEERGEVHKAAQEAIEAAADAVSASVKARRRVLDLELQLRRRAP